MDFTSYTKTNLIYRTLCGSHIYGTNVEGSDLDYVGVFIEPKEAIFGLTKIEEIDLSTKSAGKDKPNTKDDVDNKFYAFRRFVDLAASKSNPNIIELLFVRENHIQYINEWGKLLRDNANLFISKRAYDSFCGYAYAQRQRMEQSDRNPHGGRSHIVDKFGYDVKYAAHVVRLYMEGIELLSDGQLVLPLKMNKLLLDIRLGKYSKADVLVMMDEWKDRAEQARMLSSLPSKPNMEAVNNFIIDFYERYWYGKKDWDKAAYKARLQSLVDEL